MNLRQTLRRLGQQMKGWSGSLDSQSAQLPLIKKLYLQHGLELIMTCGACPEQYEVFKNGKKVAYYRLRHGEFRVDFPTCGGETIYEAEPEGDGIFENHERLKFMNNALKAVFEKLSNAP